MPTFIKPGFWTKKKEGFKGELNLNQLITSIADQIVPGSPEQLTSDAIIYNSKAPFDIKDGFETNNLQVLRHLIPLPNGKFYIMGYVLEYQKQRINGFARLNADFTLDTTFTGGGTRFFDGNTASLSFSTPTMIPVLDSVQNLYMIFDGNYVYNGYSPSGGFRNNRIFKVNSNGDFDESFSATIGTGPNTNTNSILILPDDSIICAGNFISFNGVTYGRIIRVNSDGTLANSFNTNTGSGFNGNVTQAILTPTGKILCIGAFTSYNGVARNKIAQLNIDGTLDSSFNYSSGITSTPSFPRLAVDMNTGNIYISDQIPFIYSGITSNRKIIRISSTGNYDSSFAIPTNAMSVSGGIWWAMYFDPLLNKLYYGGAAYNFASYVAGYLYRINLDGTLDTTLNNNIGEGLRSSLNYIKPIGTQYLYLCYTSEGPWTDIPSSIHKGFIIVDKNTGKLVTKFTKTLNYYD